MSETHITTNSFNDDKKLYDLPGYTFINRNRNKGKCGGVAMYIMNNLKWIRRNDLEDLNSECISIEIFPENAKSILLGTIYRPPDSSKYLHKLFNEHFENMLSTVISESKESILMGDMNIDYNKRKVNNDMKDIINSYGFRQIIKRNQRVFLPVSSISTIVNL